MEILRDSVGSSRVSEEDAVEYEHLTPAVARFLGISALALAIYTVIGVVMALSDPNRLAGFTGLNLVLGFALRVAAWPLILLTS